MGHIEFDAKPQRPRFEWVTQGTRRGPSDLFDVPLYADGAAVVVPSVGSLVPGWTLIVPTKPAPNLATLTRSERQSLELARSAVRMRLEGAFEGQIYEFEHGARTYGDTMGCGVDQAHLHLVPLPFDLLSASDALDCFETRRFTGDDSDPWNCIPADVDYWLVRDTQSGDGVIAFPRVPESQALRRLIARQLGSSEWDYKISSFPINATITRRVFSMEPKA